MSDCRKRDERPFNSKFFLEGVHKVTVTDNEYFNSTETSFKPE